MKNKKTFNKLRSQAREGLPARRLLDVRAAPRKRTSTRSARRAWATIRAQSVIDSHGKAHDVDGLYVVDSSGAADAGALNSGLTIAAVALRAAASVELRG